MFSHEKWRPAVLFHDLLILFIGIALGSYGSKMAFESGVGVSPIFMLDEGLCNIFHISLGSAILLACGVTLLAGLFLNRSAIGLTTVVTSLASGFFIDLFAPFVPPVPDGNLGRFLYMLVGLIISCFGAAIYLRLDRGGSCMEIVMLCIAQKTGFPIALARILSDVLWFTLGLAMGGTWGWGTLASLLLCGPILQISMKVLDMLLRAKTALK